MMWWTGLIPSGGMYCGGFERVTVTVMSVRTGWWTVTGEAPFTGTVSLNQVKPSNHLNFLSFPGSLLSIYVLNTKKYSRLLWQYPSSVSHELYLSFN